ncbi:MAG: hypothetical protein IJJ47_10740 [Methanosphaera sp.]|nr:hypothetical protein [Methanosphaera sp.]
MNYVYDIALNLSEKLYNFYEWNSDDNIELYIKIPIIKVDEETIKDFIKFDIVVNNDFLNRIYKKSEVFLPNKVKHNDYDLLVVSNNICLGVEFNNKGKIIKKSFLCIDEEDEILEYSKSIKYTIIDYKRNNSIKDNSIFYTRNESDNKNRILNYLKHLYTSNKTYEIDYIFLEVYNDKNIPIDKEYIKLINTVENNSNNYKKVMEVIDFMDNSKIS